MGATKKIKNIHCGQGVWEVLNTYLEEKDPSTIFVLTDANTRKHCLPRFLKQLGAKFEPIILEMPFGETNKTIAICMELWEDLTQRGADRKSVLINLGGGVVTDLGGFVACTFKRGISCVNIPTSLLAMVDAAVGGKNGVDLGAIKNQIGIIKTPELVLLDISFLESLPEAHIHSGTAEMLKHGIISSEAYFDEVISTDVTDAKYQTVIWDSVKIKNKIVAQDPNENGIRKTLNFGHTLGHAIESYCLQHEAKENLLHGEAIAIGMILATYISSELYAFPKESLEKISTGILDSFQKENFNTSDIEAICSLLIYDKKNSNGKIYFVLMEDFGQAKLNCEVPDSLIYKAFDYYENI